MQRLREISAETRAILHTASDAIVSTAKAGTILTFNASAERMFGYSAEEVIGRNVNTLTLEPSDPRHSEELAHYLVTRAMPEMGESHQGVGLRKDGSTFPLSVTLSETTVAGELRVTGFIRDFTREKARVTIASEKGCAVVAVEDTGRGFDPEAEIGGYGLLSLRERSEHLGGTLEIQSAPGAGARIVVTTLLENRA